MPLGTARVAKTKSCIELPERITHVFQFPVRLCHILSCCDDNKIKMARKPRKNQKENQLGCTGEGKDVKEIRVDKTGTVCSSESDVYIYNILREMHHNPSHSYF